MTPRPRPLVAAAALGTVYLVWGSTYLGIKIGLEGFPPFLLAAVRFGVAGGGLYLVVRRFGSARTARPTTREWSAAAVAGGLLLVGGNGAVTWAEQYVDSSVAALLVASVPLWMAVFDRVRFGQRLGPLAVTGLLLGFVGVGILVGPSTDGGSRLLASLVILGGAASWASGSLYSRGAALPDHPLVSVSMQMLAAAAMFVVLSVVTGEVSAFDPSVLGPRSVVAVAYLAVFGSVVAFTAYSWLLRNVPVATVSTYAYVNPVVAVALGWAVLAERPTGWTGLAAAVIVGAVVLIVRGRATGAGRRRPPRLVRQRRPVGIATPEPVSSPADC